MDVKRGKGPDTVERPIQIHLTRQELLDVITQVVRKKINSSVDLTEMKGVGTDNVLEHMEFTGVEIVPLNWNKPDPQPPANPA